MADAEHYSSKDDPGRVAAPGAGDSCLEAALGLGALPHPTGLKPLAKPIIITVEERGIRLSTAEGAEAWVEGQTSGKAHSALSASNLTGVLKALGGMAARGLYH